MLQSADLQRTIDWYQSILGFRLIRQEENWCRLERDGVSLMFMRNEHVGEPHATATQYIYVNDLDAFWSAIKDRVKAEWGPEEMPYGMMEFAIKDPDGYLLSFGEEMDRRRGK
jgi:catechol 2,3-dioxygenase-like lactoylglutathione lyase family enzyme